MSRVGWTLLAFFVLVVATFVSMTRFGGALRQQGPAAHPSAGNAVALIVPVTGVRRGELRDSWGEAREGGARQHHGLDIMASRGTPVLAVAAGTIEKLFDSRLGGTALYQRSPDGRWVYYYAHLAGYAPGVHEGQAVRAGDPLGYVGDTGDAGVGNYHLHFGVQRMRPGERWWQGEEVDPFPMLAGDARPL